MTDGEISPDGRWLAFVSWESKRPEIHVRPFPDVTGGYWQVSTGGGSQPRWARSSQELFYVDPSGTLMSVRVDPGRTWTSSTPTRLIELRYFVSPSQTAMYDIARDGQRFLMVRQEDATVATPANNLVIVQNWLEELKDLATNK